MSVEKIQRDLTNLFNYPSDQNPTTQADYITAVKNWVGSIVNLVDIGLWQPETDYAVGAIVRTPSLPVFALKCITAGTSDLVEPDYTDVSEGDTVTDNNITWMVCTINTTKVDPTLTISGAAADAKVTGNYVKTVVQENESFNLFDGNFDQNGYYINTSTGVITSGASYKCTSTFYPTNGATELYLLLSVSSNPCTFVFYKSDKTTVSGYVGMGAETSVYCSVPADTEYFRLFTNLSFAGTLCVSKKYTDTYVAYGKTYTVKNGVISVDNFASDAKAQIGTVVETSNSNNLFDGNFGKRKFYINTTTGVDTPTNSYKCTADFYPINGATTLYFLLSASSNPCTFVFYESDKSTVTGYYKLGTSTKGMSTIPANTAYFRLYVDINFAGTICVTSEYTDVYIPYQTTYKFKSNVVGMDNLSHNIVNQANLVDGILDDTYLNYATGAMSSFSTYRCSELIPVSASTEYIVGVYNDVNAPTYEYHNISICYYNANRTFISGAISYAGSGGVVNLTRKNNLLYITTPASCAYIRMGLHDSESPYKWYVGLSNSYNNYVDKSIKESAVGIQSNLCGKTIVCFGDSIIGNTRDETSTPFYVSLACGASVINCGFGGCRMSVHSGSWNLCSMYSLADDIYNEDFSDLASAIATGWDGMPGYFKTTIKFLEDVDFDEVDAIVISYGTNDYRGGEYPLDDSSNKFNTSTICGALRYSIKQILSKYPHIQILVTDPIIRFFFYDGTYNVEFDSDTKDWGNGTLLQYSEAYKQACKDMKVQFLDLYNSCGINQYNRLGYFDTDDGTHPNANGRARIGTMIGNRLKAMLMSK